MLLARAIRLDQLVEDGFGAFEQECFLFVTFEERPAQRIDCLALLVHHIVVLKQMFAGFEVLRFDGFLGVLNAPADKARFDRHAFGHSQAEHEGFHTLAARRCAAGRPQAKGKSGRSRDRPGGLRGLGAGYRCGRFVAFGAEDVQAAHRYDFIVFDAALRGELIVHRLPLRERHLEDFAFLLEQNHFRSRRAV